MPASRASSMVSGLVTVAASPSVAASVRIPTGHDGPESASVAVVPIAPNLVPAGPQTANRLCPPVGIAGHCHPTAHGDHGPGGRGAAEHDQTQEVDDLPTDGERVVPVREHHSALTIFWKRAQ